jgi:quercetin dioxygenase-like cupin family protein
MIIKKITTDFEDHRGVISDILVKEKIDYVTIIYNKKGAIRGNHYHKKTIQFLYVLEGSILVASQKKGQEVEEKVLKEGSLLFNEARESHAIKSLEDSKLLILTRGLRGGKDYETDTYKLDKPLLK